MTKKKTNELATTKIEETSSRRTFLKASAAISTGGLAGILASGIAPAIAQERELKVLVNSHFVPKSDEELERQLKEFGKAEGVKTRLLLGLKFLLTLLAAVAILAVLRVALGG